MQLVDIILDNRISCSFLETNDIENIIFCRPLEESLDNISLITTKSNEFIHGYIEESTEKYLITDISLEDGTRYENVCFRLVTIEEGEELPASTINLASLGSPSSTDVLPSVQGLQEEYDILTEEIKEDEDDFSILYEVPEVIDNSKIVEKIKILENKLTNEHQKLEQEKIKLSKERVILEADRKLQKTLEDYKTELLQETYLINEHQKKLLDEAVSDLTNSLQEQFDGQQINVNKYLDTLSQANLLEVKKYQDEQISKIKDSIQDLLTERLKEKSTETDRLLLDRAAALESIYVEKLVTELEVHRRNVTTELSSITNTLDGLVNEKLKENNDEVDKLLVNRSGILQDQFNESVTEQLDKHKTELFDEFKTVSTNTASELFESRTKELNTALELVINEHRTNLNSTVNQKLNEVSSSVSKFTSDIEGKLPQLDETIKDINKRLQTLVIEKKNVQLLADDARKYTDTKVAQASEEMMNYARRILDLGGGGGSVAVQYANGGTMNGNLNVTGQYLSGGVDIGTLFGGSNSGNSAVNSLVISNSSNWNNTYNTVSALSSNWSGAYTIIQSSSGNWAADYTAYTLLTANSGNWNSVYTSWNATSATSIVSFNDTRFAKLSAQVYQAGSGFNSIQPINGGNTASGNYSNVAGGFGNTANGIYSNVNGGTNNIAASGWSTIGGGWGNQALSGLSVVAGGYFNCALNWGTSIGGGQGNRALGTGSSVTGGISNTASGVYSSIGGGQNNNASGNYSNVAGGICNTASGNYSFVAGGSANDTKGFINTFILGTGLSASQANYTYVNNLSSQGSINALGGNSNQWNSVYTTVNANSATNWSYQGTDLKALSSNWQSSYTTLCANSGYWNTSYTLVQNNSASWNNALSAYSFIANGNTSIFNLSSIAPFTNAAAYIVSMNGAIQTPVTDFTITYSGTNFLNLNFTPRAGALIDVQVLGNGVITNSSVITVSSSTYNPLYTYVNSNFSVSIPTGSYAVDTTTSGVTAILPTTPTFGTTISFMDPYYTWATNNFILTAPNNIQNQNQSVAMSIAGYSFKAVYVGGTYGWRIIQ